MKTKKHFNKRKATLSFLATGLMIIWACVAMLPFAFMFCSSLKPGEEMLRKGLSLTIEPGISSPGFSELQNMKANGSIATHAQIIIRPVARKESVAFRLLKCFLVFMFKRPPS